MKGGFRGISHPSENMGAHLARAPKSIKIVDWGLRLWSTVLQSVGVTQSSIERMGHRPPSAVAAQIHDMRPSPGRVNRSVGQRSGAERCEDNMQSWHTMNHMKTFQDLVPSKCSADL
jgi:hypothetical protein